jgi:hypothetical protein
MFVVEDPTSNDESLAVLKLDSSKIRLAFLDNRDAT